MLTCSRCVYADDHRCRCSQNIERYRRAQGQQGCGKGNRAWPADPSCLFYAMCARVVTVLCGTAPSKIVTYGCFHHRPLIWFIGISLRHTLDMTPLSFQRAIARRYRRRQQDWRATADHLQCPHVSLHQAPSQGRRKSYADRLRTPGSRHGESSPWALPA